MENSQVIKNLTITIFSLMVLNSYSQELSNEYEFETHIFKPKKNIKRILNDNINVCFDENGIDSLTMQNMLQIFKRNDSLIIGVQSSPRVISDLSVEWGGANIKGVFYYKNRLTVISVKDSEVDVLRKLFKKTCKSEKVKTKLSFDDPICGRNYFLKGRKMIPLKSYNLF